MTSQERDCGKRIMLVEKQIPAEKFPLFSGGAGNMRFPQPVDGLAQFGQLANDRTNLRGGRIGQLMGRFRMRFRSLAQSAFGLRRMAEFQGPTSGGHKRKSSMDLVLNLFQYKIARNSRFFPAHIFHYDLDIQVGLTFSPKYRARIVETPGPSFAKGAEGLHLWPAATAFLFRRVGVYLVLQTAGRTAKSHASGKKIMMKT